MMGPQTAPDSRGPFLAAALLAASLVAALGLQHLLGWLPCPLCILQRIAVLVTALLFFAAGLTRAGVIRGTFKALGVLSAVGGLGICAAHLWVLANPAQGSCSPGLARWARWAAESLPGSEWLLEGSGACEDASYALLGLPLPAWTALVLASAVVLALRKSR